MSMASGCGAVRFRSCSHLSRSDTWFTLSPLSPGWEGLEGLKSGTCKLTFLRIHVVSGLQQGCMSVRARVRACVCLCVVPTKVDEAWAGLGGQELGKGGGGGGGGGVDKSISEGHIRLQATSLVQENCAATVIIR